MKHTSSKERDFSCLNFIYMIIFLLIIGCAVVSIPFGVQKYYTEKNQLQNRKFACLKALDEKDKVIENLTARIQEFKGNTIKQYAAELQLKDPQDGQLLQFDRNLVPTRYYSRQSIALSTATAQLQSRVRR